MSSLTRRIQVRQFKKANKTKLPVLTAEGFFIARRWAQTSRDLAFLPCGRAIRLGDTHETLQPVIDILAADHVRREATPEAA